MTQEAQTQLDSIIATNSKLPEWLEIQQLFSGGCEVSYYINNVHYHYTINPTGVIDQATTTNS